MKRNEIIRLLGWEHDRVGDSDLLKRIEAVVELSERDECERCIQIVIAKGQHSGTHQVRDFVKSVTKAMTSRSMFAALW